MPTKPNDKSGDRIKSVSTNPEYPTQDKSKSDTTKFRKPDLPHENTDPRRVELERLAAQRLEAFEQEQLAHYGNVDPDNHPQNSDGRHPDDRTLDEEHER